jgi:hypothetical protein
LALLNKYFLSLFTALFVCTGVANADDDYTLKFAPVDVGAILWKQGQINEYFPQAKAADATLQVTVQNMPAPTTYSGPAYELPGKDVVVTFTLIDPQGVGEGRMENRTPYVRKGRYSRANGREGTITFTDKINPAEMGPFRINYRSKGGSTFEFGKPTDTGLPPTHRAPIGNEVNIQVKTIEAPQATLLSPEEQK